MGKCLEQKQSQILANFKLGGLKAIDSQVERGLNLSNHIHGDIKTGVVHSACDTLNKST